MSFLPGHSACEIYFKRRYSPSIFTFPVCWHNRQHSSWPCLECRPSKLYFKILWKYDDWSFYYLFFDLRPLSTPFDISKRCLCWSCLLFNESLSIYQRNITTNICYSILYLGSPLVNGHTIFAYRLGDKHRLGLISNHVHTSVCILLKPMLKVTPTNTFFNLYQGNETHVYAFVRI